MAGLSLAPFTTGGGDFGVDLLHRQFVEAMPLRAAPGFFEPVRRRGEGLHIIAHAQDEYGGFTIPLYEEAVVVLDGATPCRVVATAGAGVIIRHGRVARRRCDDQCTHIDGATLSWPGHASAGRGPAVGEVSVRLSESRDAEIARHDRCASAARKVHGHAAATRQPQRAGAHEARFERRRFSEIAGAHSNDDSRSLAAHLVHCRFSRRNRRRFQGVMRLRESCKARLDGRLRVFRRGQRGEFCARQKS